MSNFSSIGVSRYEIYRDRRVSWSVAARAPIKGAHWPHDRRGENREECAEESRGKESRGAREPTLARDGRRPGRLRAPPAGRTLPVSAHGPGLPGPCEYAAGAPTPGRRPAARGPEGTPPAQLATRQARL